MNFGHAESAIKFFCQISNFSFISGGWGWGTAARTKMSPRPEIGKVSNWANYWQFHFGEGGSGGTQGQIQDLIRGGAQIMTGLNCQQYTAASCEQSEPFSAWGLGPALGPWKLLGILLLNMCRATTVLGRPR